MLAPLQVRGVSIPPTPPSPRLRLPRVISGALDLLLPLHFMPVRQPPPQYCLTQYYIGP
jgi:hypothetical protein